MYNPQKALPSQNRVVWRIERQNPFTVSPDEPKKRNIRRFRVFISRIWGKKPSRIESYIVLAVGARDVIRPYKFGDDRLRGLGLAEGIILPFPIDLQHSHTPHDTSNRTGRRPDYVSDIPLKGKTYDSLLCVMSDSARKQNLMRDYVDLHCSEAVAYLQTQSVMFMQYILCIGVVSYGALGHVPPRLLAIVILGDHSLYRLWRVMHTVFCPVERFLAIGSADCHWIVALLCNKFQLHAYFRFR